MPFVKVLKRVLVLMDYWKKCQPAAYLPKLRPWNMRSRYRYSSSRILDRPSSAKHSLYHACRKT